MFGRERRLVRNRDRVVHEGLDAGRTQVRLHRPAPRCVPGRGDTRVRRRARRDDNRVDFAQSVPVTAGEQAPPFGPGAEERQARPQHCRLEFIEARVDAELIVAVLVGLAAVAKADRRQIGKSWSTLGSTRDAAVSCVSSRTTRPPSGNGSRLYSSSPATSMPTVPIAMAAASENTADDRERGICRSRRAPSFQSSRDRRHRASLRRRA